MTKTTTTFDIAACMIFRDEAHILAEWLEYHLMLGIEHFFLYSHMSKDNYKEVLQPYIKNKQVTLMEWNFPRRRYAPGGGGPYPQVTAYDHALSRLRGVAKWIVVIDSDEFLAQMSDVTLSDFLAQQGEVAGVVLNWAMFGTSGHKTRPEGLILENYTHRGEQHNLKHRHVKPIINPLCVNKALDPHQWRAGCSELGLVYPFVDEHGTRLRKQTQTEPFLSWAGTPAVSWDLFRINHYATRSEEEFAWKIRSRGRLSSGVHDEDGWFEHHFRTNNLNDEEDTHMLKHVPELRKRLRGRNHPYSRLLDIELHRINR
jgi:hypothetical protein